jgi:hypothetical protein
VKPPWSVLVVVDLWGNSLEKSGERLDALMIQKEIWDIELQM